MHVLQSAVVYKMSQRQRMWNIEILFDEERI